MSFIGIQIISIIFIIFMLYVVNIHYKKGDLPPREAIFWFVVMLAVGFIVVVPNTAEFVIQLFSVSRLTDFLTAIALMILFLFMIDSRIQINKLNKKLEYKVRDRAIKNALKKS